MLGLLYEPRVEIAPARLTSGVPQNGQLATHRQDQQGDNAKNPAKRVAEKPDGEADQEENRAYRVRAYDERQFSEPAGKEKAGAEWCGADVEDEAFAGEAEIFPVGGKKPALGKIDALGIQAWHLAILRGIFRWRRRGPGVRSESFRRVHASNAALPVSSASIDQTYLSLPVRLL